LAIYFICNYQLDLFASCNNQETRYNNQIIFNTQYSILNKYLNNLMINLILNIEYLFIDYLMNIDY